MVSPMRKPELRLVSAEQPEADDAVVLRVAQGDIGALGTLYDRYARSLLGFVRRHAPEDDAEDVVQITFLRATEIASRFREGANAKPWLFGIALQILRERRRSLRRFANALASLSVRPARHAPEPSATRRDVQRALARLSEAKRVVLLLAEVEGFSGPEIAEIIGVPVGTVWTRLHHARRELRESLEESQ
jgi:RNA polymerase sigma factor (sigma-70 family)